MNLPVAVPALEQESAPRRLLPQPHEVAMARPSTLLIGRRPPG